MRNWKGRVAVAIATLAVISGEVMASGYCIPVEKSVPPLALVRQKVTAAIEDQAATTVVEQTFRNHTSQNLEAEFVFPVPRGASVDKFSMWIDGKETNGELLPADKAKGIYTDIVRRIQDPGLLEYIGSDLMRVKVFPIPPRGDQKIKINYKSLALRDGGIVEYLCPVRTDGKSHFALEEFSFEVVLKSKKPIKSIFSPTHAVDIKRDGESGATVSFAKSQSPLDRDFQLFYGIEEGTEGNVGATTVVYRPVSSEEGTCMLLLTPKESLANFKTPRDLVLVLDKSGSMSDQKMTQAKRALKKLLGGLRKEDRFGLIAFSSSVNLFEDHLLAAEGDRLEKAEKWVDDLRSGGGTAIKPALEAALDLYKKDKDRTFTIAFFTDGVPTIDERDPDRIVKEITKQTSTMENVRLFTFGVGDDVNAAMLDQLAESTRAVGTYVRPSEDIEVKATALAEKISRPAMTNLKLSCEGIKLTESYPARLPDLFHGGQVVVFAKFTGKGTGTIKLTGTVAGEEKSSTFLVEFPGKTDSSRDFVEQLWARRKVGYLLDQIRISGESKEVVDEVTALAKKYGIATPYTSHLVVPDGPIPVIPRPPHPHPPHPWHPMPGTLKDGEGKETKLENFAREQADGKGGVGAKRVDVTSSALEREGSQGSDGGFTPEEGRRLRDINDTLQKAQQNFQGGNKKGNQEGKMGVDLALIGQNLRGQDRLTPTASKVILGRNCLDFGGVWIDEKFEAKTKSLTVKAQSDAYFALLEAHPELKDLFRLGNYLVWVTPSGTALVIDFKEGKETLTRNEIEALFKAP